MHPDPQVVLWLDYQEFYRWLCQEVDGLTDTALDFDSHDPAHEWMWWSICRQVSHVNDCRLKATACPSPPVRRADARHTEAETIRRLTTAHQSKMYPGWHGTWRQYFWPR